MGKWIKLPLPFKGINKYTPREAQPDGTTSSAMNVLPFDRYGRMRIGQRPGTGQLWDDAIGSSNPIQMIQQTAIGLSTDNSVPQNVESETFTYSNGVLDTVSSSAWATTAAPTNPTGRTGNTVSSGKVFCDANKNFSRFVTSPAAGHTKYSVSMKVHIGTSASMLSSTLFHAGLVTRHSGTPSSTGACVQLKLENSGGAAHLRLKTHDNTQLKDTTVTIAAETDYILKIDWDGDAYVCYFNGVEAFSGTTTEGTGQTGIGFQTGDFTSSTTNWYYDDLTVDVNLRAAVTRQTDIVAVSDGNVYMGNPGTQAALTTSGSSVLDADSLPSGAVLFGKMYLTDGGNDLTVLDIATKTCSTWSSSAGSETATTLGKYTIAVPWRGRLILGHDKSSPQNFVASKVGDPTDFDYTATTPDAAFAGNAAVEGQISDPITALIPASDDVLIIGTDHGLHTMTGDIAAGGSINLVSDSIGILSATSWTKAPDGTIYFIGTTGLFSIAPGSRTPTALSDKTYNQFFKALNRKTQYINMVWDRDRHGAFIFVTPVVSGTATHLFYDAREGGFWELQYPDDHGPVSACVYDGDDPTDRYLLMGGRSGLVQIQSDVDRTDNGTAISASVVIGPFQPNPATGDSIITNIAIVAGEVFTGDATSVWNMNWQLSGGKTPYEVTDGTARRMVAGNMGIAGFQSNRVQRLRGGWFTLKLYNTAAANYFSIESVSVNVLPAGMQR